MYLQRQDNDKTRFGNGCRISFRKGLTLVLLSLAKKISLTIQELADIMHISERTLQRYDDDAIIKTEYAEKP